MKVLDQEQDVGSGVNDGQVKGRQVSDMSPTALVPNAPYDFDFSLWPVTWRIAAERHLRIKLSGDSVDYLLPPEPTPTTVTVHQGGTEPSYIVRPVRRNN